MIDAVLIVFDRAPFRGEEINYFGTGRSDSTMIASVGVKICERGDKYLEMEVDMQSGDAMQFPSNTFAHLIAIPILVILIILVEQRIGSITYEGLN